jgi:hypothetical protein
VAAAEDPAKPAGAAELDNPHLVNHWAQEPRARDLWAAAARASAGGNDDPTESVRQWIELASELGQWLMPQPADPELTEHFRSTHTAARARLAALTPAQRRRVRGLLDGPASRALTLARRRATAEALEAVAEQFPWSSSAVPALIDAGNLRLEAGDTGGAGWAYRMALVLRDDRPGPADAQLVLRCGRALAAAGRATEVRLLAQRLAERVPGLTLPGADGPVPAPEVLRALADRARPAAEVWPEPDPTGGPGAEPPPLGRVRRTWEQPDGELAYRRLDDAGDMPPDPSPFLPVAADGVVVLNHGTALHAYDLVTLKVVWPGPRGLSERDALNRPHTRTAWSSGATISGRAVAGTVEYPSRARRLAGRSNRIVVLDLHTGVPIAPDCAGSAVERQLAPIIGPSDQFRFSGAPLWRGGRLYAAVLRQRREAEEVWVVALAPVTSGREIAAWRVARWCYVTTRAQNFHDSRSFDELQARITDAGDRIILATSTGSVSAIDPLTCRVQWLVKYRLAGDTFDGESSFLPGRVSVSGDTVAVGPKDSDTLYLLDRATGRLLWARTGKTIDPDQYAKYLAPERTSGPWRAVLGIRHGRVFVQRDRSIEILPLSEERVEGRRVVWDDQALQIQQPDRDSAEPPAVMGRPAFGARGCAVSGGSTLVLLPVRRSAAGGGAGDAVDAITMTGTPIDEINLDALPVPELAAQGPRRRGPLLAGACLRFDAWGVPRRCAEEVPSGPGHEDDGDDTRICDAWLPVPREAGPVRCPACGHTYTARRVRHLVLVSRDFLTRFELDPPTPK